MPSTPIDMQPFPKIKADSKNEYIRTIVEALSSYNRLAAQSGKEIECCRHLDDALFAAGQWLTQRPRQWRMKNKTDSGAGERWKQLLLLVEAISMRFRNLRFKELSLKQKSGGSTWQLDDSNYWLERVDQLHRSGDALKPHFEKWLDMAPVGGGDYTQSLSFWDYLQAKKVSAAAQTDTTAKKLYQDLDKQVSYEADIRRRYQLTIEKNTLKDCDLADFSSEAMSTNHSGGGWAIFVACPAGEIFAGTHVIGEFHHTTFLNGAPVQAAGEFVVENGKILCLTSKSGHYKPTALQMLAFVQSLLKKGVFAANAVVQLDWSGEFFPIHELKDVKRVANLDNPADPQAVYALLPRWAQNDKAKKAIGVP